MLIEKKIIYFSLSKIYSNDYEVEIKRDFTVAILSRIYEVLSKQQQLIMTNHWHPNISNIFQL